MFNMRGFWRGKMNRNSYEEFFLREGLPPQYSGAPVNDPNLPIIEFGLSIARQFNYFENRPGSATLMILSGEVGHFSISGAFTLPVNGFYADNNTVQLNFYNLIGVPATFLGYFENSTIIVGDWTQTRQWNDWTDPAGLDMNHFAFGKMSFQKIVSIEDIMDFESAKNLFLP
jgi:hypothetical protein